MKNFWKTFPHYVQLDTMDCGPACLRMIAKYYGRNYTLDELRQRSFMSRNGVTLLGLSDAAESIGMRTMGVKLTMERLIKERPLPAFCIGIRTILWCVMTSSPAGAAARRGFMWPTRAMTRWCTPRASCAPTG